MRTTSTFFVPPELVRVVVVLVVVVGEVHIEQTFGKVQNELLYFSFHVDFHVIWQGDESLVAVVKFHLQHGVSALVHDMDNRGHRIA